MALYRKHKIFVVTISKNQSKISQYQKNQSKFLWSQYQKIDPKKFLWVKFCMYICTFIRSYLCVCTFMQCWRDSAQRVQEVGHGWVRSVTSYVRRGAWCFVSLNHGRNGGGRKRGCHRQPHRGFPGQDDPRWKVCLEYSFTPLANRKYSVHARVSSCV